jgi:hypothetical protein
MTRFCAFPRVVRRYSYGAWTSRRRPGPVLRLEVIAADIPFATGSLAVFQGMPDQKDDTWPALGRQA